MANSIIAPSTYRYKEGQSVYETACNSVDNSIDRTRVSVAEISSSSMIYGESVGTATITDIYRDQTRRPLLSPQNSILALKSTIWPPYNDSSKMQV